jgi:predicted  nucleic acid-binding Zn-ribbon protein
MPKATLADRLRETAETLEMLAEESNEAGSKKSADHDAEIRQLEETIEHLEEKAANAFADGAECLDRVQELLAEFPGEQFDVYERVKDLMRSAGIRAPV